MTVEAEQSPVAQESSGLEGHYVYAKSLDHGRAIVRKAMGAMIDQLNPIYRSIARRKLQNSDPLVRAVTISRPNGKISVRLIGEKSATFVTRPGVREKAQAPNGREIDVTQRIKGGVLTQVLLGPKGRTTNRYTLSNKGQRLVFDSKVEGQDLDEPVSYRLVYKRSTDS